MDVILCAHCATNQGYPAAQSGVHLVSGADLAVGARRGRQDLEKDASIGNHLMHLHQREHNPLPFTRMWSELSIFFMAGMETTAHAITWAL